MPEIGDKIVRSGIEFEYIGYGKWSQVNLDSDILNNQTNEEQKVQLVFPTDDLSLADAKQEPVQNLMGQVLKELKIMNFHLSLLTDITINKTEVE